MSASEKRSKATLISAEVDALFHTAEKANPEHNVTYLDIVRITDRVREHFDHNTPPQIEGALSIATGLCHPKKIEGINLIRKGSGALISCAGGSALLWGIIHIIVFHLSVSTTTGMLWWTSTHTTILFGGPVGIAVGLASLSAGIYVLSLKAPVKKRAVMALDVIKKGIDNWVAAEAQQSLPEIKWVKKLSGEEFFALVSLAWRMADADKVLTQDEMLIIDHILNVRKPTAKAVIEGFGSTPAKQAVDILRLSKYADKCFDLIKLIAKADGTVSPEEDDILKLIQAN